ncbi:hypothetical protein L3X38_038905 [Prunus dulcis]|uniref:Uncharacterized protein n=1 Tax=Prunus dulcis TaxID=3755 RepID=A0AAD4V7P7_PRUDU|nr:hypothetical protein L3X38_038905 [Prunus dulcis]
MHAVERILRYLKSAPGKGLLFSKPNHFGVEAYKDVDWAGSISYRRSTTWYCTIVGGDLVTWRSSQLLLRPVLKQNSRAKAHGVCELLWLRIFLRDLKIAYKDPMNLCCDNKAAISIVHSPIQHDRTKHVEIDRHFIKEKLTEGVICTPYVRSEDQLAGILTKGVSSKVIKMELS